AAGPPVSPSSWQGPSGNGSGEQAITKPTAPMIILLSIMATLRIRGAVENLPGVLVGQLVALASVMSNAPPLRAFLVSRRLTRRFHFVRIALHVVSGCSR